MDMAKHCATARQGVGRLCSSTCGLGRDGIGWIQWSPCTTVLGPDMTVATRRTQLNWSGTCPNSTTCTSRRAQESTQERRQRASGNNACIDTMRPTVAPLHTRLLPQTHVNEHIWRGLSEMGTRLSPRWLCQNPMLSALRPCNRISSKACTGAGERWKQNGRHELCTKL